MPKRRNPPPIPRGQKQHAVVLLHGILGQSLAYWNVMKRYLQSDRYHFHEVRMPFFGFGDLRKAATRLAEEVDHVIASAPRETDDGRVDLIAHSAGGLVARYFVRFLGGDARVHSLVTLGSPHHGTYTSHLFPLATVARQTTPGSEFLEELNAGDETPGHVHYTSIYSLADGVVIPASSAHLRGARNVQVNYVTHWGFLWRPRVYRYIQEAIDHRHGAYQFWGDVDREEDVEA